MFEIIPINGSTLLFSACPGLETASLGIFLRVGARHEKKKFKGIAHFLEHTVFKGSRRYSYRKIKQEIEGRGGSLNAFTSHEVTAYYVHFLKKNLPHTLDILLDMVYWPRFQQSEVHKERKVILEEIKMYNDLPASRAVMLLDQLLWQRHPLGEEVVGTVPAVSRIQSVDLRAFQESYYLPTNMVVSFSGDYPKNKLIGLLKAALPHKNTKTSLTVSAPGPLLGRHIQLEKKNLQQSHLCVGFRSHTAQSPLRHVTQLIHIILGANMSSRLFEELREKRSLCYDISTELRRYQDSGAFLIHAGLDSQTVPKALKTIAQTLRKLKNSAPSAHELRRSKDYLLGQVAMNLERPQGRMFHMAEHFLTLGAIDDYTQIQQHITRITPEQIHRVSNSIFNFKNLCISCVGNVDEARLGEQLKQAISE